METTKSSASGASGSRRRDRRDRATTVSGAIPYHHNEATNERAMRFPWSSPSEPTSPAIPVNPSSGLQTITTTMTSAAGKSSGHRRALSGNILSKLNFLRSSSGEDARSIPRETRPAGPPVSPTKALFGRRSGGVEDSAASSPSPQPDNDEVATGDVFTAGSAFTRKSVDDDVPLTSPTSPDADKERESALSVALKQVKPRKRKGSLRKTALLGGRRILSEGRERKASFSLLPRPGSTKQGHEPVVQEDDYEGEAIQDDSGEGNDQPPLQPKPASTVSLSARRGFNYENAIASASSENVFLDPPAATMARLSLLTDHQAQSTTSRTKVNDLGSPVDAKSPTSATSYTSTTSDDDLLSIPSSRQPHPLPSQNDQISTPLSTTSAGSYFPEFPAPRRPHPNSRTHTPKRSPLSRSLSAYPDTKSKPANFSPHSYTETEYWGWIILFITWLTFTVGMGSCLEIWSWAWDVGETPYAPPELEDDESLPIVGYYPALIVLTGGVVSWVWVAVAWVGMKYFRHAKIEV